MNINLYENYYLKSDPLNYILYQKTIVNDEDSKNYGEEYESIVGYFTTIENALVAMCRREIRACKCTTLNGLIKEVNILRECIKGLCNEIGADKVVQNTLIAFKDEDKLLEQKMEKDQEKKAAKEAKKEAQAEKKKRGRKKKEE